MTKFENKKCLVLGLGVSGVSITKFLCQKGAQVTITDQKKESDLGFFKAQLSAFPVNYELGGHPLSLLDGIDFLVVSPGIPYKSKFIEEAKSRNIPITSEIEIAAECIQKPWIVITGTNGKTTTTTLIGELFKADGKSVFVGGNIGKPMIEYVLENAQSDFIVAELSSFQIQQLESLKVSTIVVTNLEEDHLDHYPNLMTYFQAKIKILKFASSETNVIFNYDSPALTSFAELHAGDQYWFTKKNPMAIHPNFAEQFLGAYMDQSQKKIHIRLKDGTETFDWTGFRLFGEHNRENLMAALMSARLAGVSFDAVASVITSFKGIPHRLEFVRKKDGVYFFNDSKGTNPHCVLKSLNSFHSNPMILIAGGKDKNSDFSCLADIVKKRCKILILVGEAKEKINRALGDFTETYLVGTFEEAVLLAYQKSRSGDIILLSPGCSSFDMFHNYEERGDYFKKLVFQL